MLKMLKIFFLLTGFALSGIVHSAEIAFDDNLTEGQRVINTLRIVGWAKTPSSTGYVLIDIDGVSLGRAAYPLQRSDVPNSGFILEIDTLGKSNGTHKVSAGAYDSTGKLIEVVSRNFVFANITPRGAIEGPGYRDPASGLIGVTGWALADGGFKKLEIHVNGRFAANADYGLPRSDVQAQFPEYNIANGGFYAAVNLDSLGLPRGFHRISLVGVDGKDTRHAVAESEFFYTTGRVGRNWLDFPEKNSEKLVDGSLRVTGWSEGDFPASRVDVYLNDRLIGSTTDLTANRTDVPDVFPGAKNVRGFDFNISSRYLIKGNHRIVAVATDTAGQRHNLDVFSGPVNFTVTGSDKMFGAHLRPQNDYAGAINMYAAGMGDAKQIVMYFQPWRNAAGVCSPFNTYPFLPQRASESGAIPMITWEPLQEGMTYAQNLATFSYDKILSGVFDTCLTQYARDVRDFANPVMMRFGHEMNGNSNSWTGIANGNNPDKYISVYRKIVDIFRTEGATNALFVWSPDHASPPEVPAPSNELRNYYPGSGYVDFIGVSGYNWGNDPLRGGGWVTASQVFNNFLTAAARDFPSKPILLTEVGSVPGYGSNSRSTWYTEAFSFFSATPALKGIVWFNDFAFANTTMPDFRITDTPTLGPVNSAETSLLRGLVKSIKPASVGH